MNKNIIIIVLTLYILATDIILAYNSGKIYNFLSKVKKNTYQSDQQGVRTTVNDVTVSHEPFLPFSILFGVLSLAWAYLLFSEIYYAKSAKSPKRSPSPASESPVIADKKSGKIKLIAAVIQLLIILVFVIYIYTANPQLDFAMSVSLLSPHPAEVYNNRMKIQGGRGAFEQNEQDWAQDHISRTSIDFIFWSNLVASIFAVIVLYFF